MSEVMILSHFLAACVGLIIGAFGGMAWQGRKCEARERACDAKFQRIRKDDTEHRDRTDAIRDASALKEEGMKKTGLDAQFQDLKDKIEELKLIITGRSEKDLPVVRRR